MYNKTETDSYREQWGEGKGEEPDGGRRLRDTNYYVENR